MKKKYNSKYEQIALWDRITLTVTKEGERSEFLTRVEDIKRDSYVLEMPIRQSGKGQLMKGDDVEVSYNKKDAAYTFKASIVDLFEEAGKSIQLVPKSEVRPAQRRRFVRLDIAGEIVFREVDMSDSTGGGIGSECHGSLLNISAGGVLFETEKEVQAGEVLILTFSLKEKEKLENILAVVKRQESIDDELFLVGAEFITNENLAEIGLESLGNFLPSGTGTFDENLQRLVVQFISRQQVELRKKGILS